jgi:antibiotic biosynthesis monooxygenase (ABM) superfamily enzyme
MDTNSEAGVDEGATAVITHRVRVDKHAAYEEWLDEIAPVCRASLGHIDWHIVRPVAGVTETYTIIIRFDTPDHLQQWMDSSTRAHLIESVRPSLVDGDGVFISSGLDFLFTPKGGNTLVPVRWKQCLITWSAIYPLVLAVPYFVKIVLGFLGVTDNHFVTTLFVTGTVVYLMVYWVMPRYTKLIKRWLFS